VVEPLPFRRNVAQRWADEVYDIAAFFKQPPKQIDVVIEASGSLSNVKQIFRQVNAAGRIVLLARSREPLVLDTVDHMITNAISMIGSRGHLCGAFDKILMLYRQGRIPLGDLYSKQRQNRSFT